MHAYHFLSKQIICDDGSLTLQLHTHTQTAFMYQKHAIMTESQLNVTFLKDLKKSFRFTPPFFRFLLSLYFVRIIANVD